MLATMILALIPFGFPAAIGAEDEGGPGAADSVPALAGIPAGEPASDTASSGAFADVPAAGATGAAGQKPGVNGEPDGYRSLFFNDVLLRGTSARYDSFFEIGKGLRSAKGSRLVLQYSISPYLLPERSSLTVYVDDRPVASRALDPSQTADHTWTVDLSDLRLESGFHKVTLAVAMRTDDRKVCEDPRSDKLWMIAGKESRAELSLVPAYEQPDLSWFPSPFLERGSRNLLRAIMVVPDDPDTFELAAAARLSQFFVAESPDKRLAIPVYTESEVTDELLGTWSVIWIGETGRWKKAGLRSSEAALQAAGETGAIGAGTGAIRLIPSPWNENRSHLLLTGTGPDLAKGAEILTDYTMIEQLQGTVVPIAASPETIPAAPAAQEERTVISSTLNELGYGNLSVRNVQEGTVNFQYALPPGLTVGGPVQLALSFSHSDAIRFAESMMTVSVNGTPVKSVRLTSRTADGATAEVWIDPAIVGTGRNISVDVQFLLADPPSERAENYEEECEDDPVHGWAVIDGNSSMHIPLAKRSAVDLQYVPFPFVGDTFWENTLVLARRWGSEELQLAMTIIGLFGAANPKTDALKFALTGTSGWSGEARGANVIYVGAAGDLPAEFNGYSGSFFRAEGSRIAALSEAVKLAPPLTERLAFMQLTESPLAADKALLIAAVASGGRLPALSAALADPEQAFQWTGRFVAVRPDGTVINFPETAAAVPQQMREPVPVNNRWSQFSIGETGFLIAVLIMIALLALMYGLLRRQPAGR